MMMASKLEMKEAEDAYERLQKAVLAYLSEIDNPVPDATMRRICRNHLREITGAPAEPPPRRL
jgi:hypothetical protein